MEFIQKNENELNINDNKNSKELNQCHSVNDEDQNFKSNFDKNTLNLFKGIVKITNVSTNNKNKAPINKSNSASVKNLLNYTNNLYKNEEHLYKNRINIIKNCENNLFQETPIKTFSHKFSMNEKCEKSISSMMIPNLSKEKNITTVRKSLFKKSSCNDIGFGSKKQSKNGIGIKTKFVESSTNNNKLSQKYSFFYKLKEKEKNPSKTPYLDKKNWNSSYNLNKYNYNNNPDDKNKKNNSNILFVDQIQSQKNKLNNLIEKGKNKEIIIVQKDLNEKILPNINKADNNDNTNIKIEMGEKEKEKIIDNNIGIIENKNNLQNKKPKKNSNGIIINILNKPFFCCLKS